MAEQVVPSVDGTSDLSALLQDGTVHELDFFPGANHSVVNALLHDNFRPVSLMQKLKHEHCDDAFKEAFPNHTEIPCELQGDTCKSLCVEKVRQMKPLSEEAINQLQQLYSAFRCSSGSSENRSVLINVCSEIVSEYAERICYSARDLLNNVKCRRINVEKLMEEVSARIKSTGQPDELGRFKKLIKWFEENFLKPLLNTTVQLSENAENHKVAEQTGRQLTKMQNLVKEESRPLEKLYMKLTMLDLHLSYAHFFLEKLKVCTQSLHIACEDFCLIALGKEQIQSEQHWKDLKRDVLYSNAWWVAIDRLLDEF